MTDDKRYKIDPNLGLEINKALVFGDVEELFRLIAEYLDRNDLKVPEHIIDTYQAAELIE